MSRVYFSLSLDPPSLSIYPLLPASFPWGHQSRRRRPLSRGRGGFKARFCARAAASSANITRPMGAKRGPCMAWRVQHVALTEGSKSGRECICTSITLKFLDFCRISYMQAHKGRWLLNSPLFSKCSTCLVKEPFLPVPTPRVYVLQQRMGVSRPPPLLLVALLLAIKWIL